MGQKVHPTGMRLGISTEWTSKWYAEGRNYAELLSSDLEIRDYLRKKLSQASVSRIQINRPARAVFITIHTARPGIVIGKKGEDQHPHYDQFGHLYLASSQYSAQPYPLEYFEEAWYFQP